MAPRAVAQATDIAKRMLYEFLASWILSAGCLGVKLYKILRLGGGLGPSLRRRRKQKLFEFFLATPQSSLIGVKLLETLTANFCRFLSGHASALVEVDRVVCHGLEPFVWLRRFGTDHQLRLRWRRSPNQGSAHPRFA